MIFPAPAFRLPALSSLRRLALLFYRSYAASLGFDGNRGLSPPAMVLRRYAAFVDLIKQA